MGAWARRGDLAFLESRRVKPQAQAGAKSRDWVWFGPWAWSSLLRAVHAIGVHGR
jgi:hypothetical protein